MSSKPPKVGSLTTTSRRTSTEPSSSRRTSRHSSSTRSSAGPPSPTRRAALGVPVEWHEGRRLSVAGLKSGRHPFGAETVAVGRRMAEDGHLDAAVIGRAVAAVVQDPRASSGYGTASRASGPRSSKRLPGRPRRGAGDEAGCGTAQLARPGHARQPKSTTSRSSGSWRR